MSDNLDPKNIDQEWEKMAHILNQELPVKEKKKTGFWWFLIPMLFVALGLGALGVWQYQQPAQNAYESQKSSTKKSTESRLESSPTALDINAAEDQKTTRSSLDNKVNRKVETDEISTQNDSRSIAIAKDQKKSTIHPMRNAHKGETNVPSQTKTHLPLFKSKPSVPSNPFVTRIDKNESFTFQTQSRPLTLRQGLSAQRFFFEKPFKRLPKVNLSLTPSILKWDISIFMGGNIERNNLTALSALHEVGVTFNYYLNPKTTFNLGLGFESKNINPLAIESKYDVYRENGLISHTVLEQRSYGIIRSTGLTFGINQKLNKHFSVSGGLYLHKNLQAIVSGSQTTVFSFQQNDETFQPKNTPISYNPKDLISPYSFGTNVSANYTINRTSISILYKQGLNDFTNNTFFKNQVKNFTQYLGLRMSYRVFTKQVQPTLKAITYAP